MWCQWSCILHTNKWIIKKNSSKSNSNFSVNRMQRSIFSNTVYKNRTSLVGIRVPPPPQRTRQWSKDQASCIFLKAATFSVRPRGTQSCSALIQSLRTSWREKKEEKNNFCLSTVPQDFITGLVALPNIQMAAPSCSSVQLFVLQMWEMSNLSKTSHAEIARRERKKKKKKARQHLHNPRTKA